MITPSLEPSTTMTSLRCDVLLIVATTTEKEKLEAAAKEFGLSFQRRQGRFFRYYDLGNVGSFRVMAVKTEMGPFSYDGSAARILTAKTETMASAVIALGMAFGVSRSIQKLGDVIVSRMLLPYDNRRVHSENELVKTDYSNVEVHKAKESLISVLDRHAQQPEWSKVVNFGAVLTGGARIHCAGFRDELVRSLSHHGDTVVGGEMEGAGLLASCPKDSPIWIVVKGICDFADEDRDKEYEGARPVACENSAKFVLSALKAHDPESSNQPVKT
jgi:nucleoside phosphorylase